MTLDSLIYPLAMTLHGISAVIWVGGMFFAYVALRPAAATVLAPAERLTLWSQTLQRFFVWVWLAVILLPLTGYWMIFSFFNGFASVGLHVHLMQALGLVMILIYLHVFFAPYQKLRRAVKAENFPEGAKSLAQIRQLVGLNLLIGLVVLVIALGLEHVSL
ncbi:MAG: CopD family protein [Gammaproteobacteria bacterium]|nr:CopD family protein [Gammaproteobacteria bacterium]